MNTDPTQPNVAATQPVVPPTVSPAAQTQPGPGQSYQEPAPIKQGVSEDTKTIVTVLLLIFVFPIGLIVMLFWPKWKWWVKLLVVLPMLLLSFFLAAAILLAINPSESIEKAKCVTACEETGATDCVAQCSEPGSTDGEMNGSAVAPTSSAQPQSEAVTETTYVSPQCGVTFTYPEKQSEYYTKTTNGLSSDLVGTGSYWQVPRGTISPNALLLADQYLTAEQYQQVNAVFTSNDAANGNIPAAVSVSCTEMGVPPTVEKFISYLEYGIKEYNDPTFVKGMGPNSYTLSSAEKITKWGMDVMKINLNEDTYYIFVHNYKLYEVRAMGTTEVPEIVSQRDQILNTLTFD